MIEVQRVTDDRLTREVWKFDTQTNHNDKIKLVLYIYSIQARKTTRHGWKVDPAQRWDRFDQRGYYSGIKAQDVPLPLLVAQEAKALLDVGVIGTSDERVL